MIVGVTGPIACGKSAVDGMMLALGAGLVIDADQVVHELLAGDRTVQTAVADRFGGQLLSETGIDRPALGAIVFADVAALRDLERILHPAVQAYIVAMISALPAGATAIIDAVKLLQGPLGGLCDSRWWVTAHPEQQLARLMERRGMSREDALRRIAASPRLEDWRHAVDVVIDNSGSLAATRRQVEGAWRALHVPRYVDICTLPATIDT